MDRVECWWAQPSSHDGSLHAHSRARSVRGTQLMAAGWDFAETKALLGSYLGGYADVQNQIERVVMNKAIYQKVATAMAELGYSRTWRRAKLTATNSYRHENEIHIFSFYLGGC